MLLVPFAATAASLGVVGSVEAVNTRYVLALLSVVLLATPLQVDEALLGDLRLIEGH